jgi:hypothetical protein
VADVLSPDWWVERLYAGIVARQTGISLYDAYYRGDHPLPWLAPQARAEFRRILRMTRSNYMGLVVDAMTERLQVEGFRLAEAEQGDAETWRIWQANNLDSDSDQGILEAAICGQSYLLVAPNADDPATPNMWVEHPSQAIVEFEPGTSRRTRAAGLKVWDDDWTGELHATLYLPDGLYKFRSDRPAQGSGGRPRWEVRSVAGEDWPAPNPLGVVPLVELPNNPRLLLGGISELADVTDIQDRVNKTLADRLVTQDYGSFPQKWATAWPEQDEQGNPTPPIDVGRNRMVTTEVAETRFGQFEAAALDPYSTAKREDVKDIASRTRTPAQYLLGEMSNVNGETLKAAESGLVSKVRQRMRTYAEGFEQAMRLARRAAGLPDAGARGMETIWRNPEFRTEGELTDAVVKRLQTGIASLRQAREDVGYSAAQIARLEAEDAAAAVDPTLAAVARTLTQPQPATAPVGQVVPGAAAGNG